MPDSLQTFTPPGWLKLGSVLAAAFFSAAAYVLSQSGRTLAWLPMGVIAAFTVLTAVDALTTRISLSETRLSVRRNLRHFEHAREAVLQASWEGGAPVSVEVAGLGWIRLPYVGHALSLLQALESWIRREPSDRQV